MLTTNLLQVLQITKQHVSFPIPTQSVRAMLLCQMKRWHCYTNMPSVLATPSAQSVNMFVLVLTHLYSPFYSTWWMTKTAHAPSLSHSYLATSTFYESHDQLWLLANLVIKISFTWKCFYWLIILSQLLCVCTYIGHKWQLQLVHCECNLQYACCQRNATDVANVQWVTVRLHLNLACWLIQPLRYTVASYR